MLFNSYLYIYLFLPVSVAVYFLLYRRSSAAARWWLISCNLVYYGWWDPRYLLLFGLSLAGNYCAGHLILAKMKNPRFAGPKAVTAAGILFNVALLGLFKYADFFISNVNMLTGETIPLPGIALPLGISFYTFIQIAYLVDIYRGAAAVNGPAEYLSFASFYPQLFSGPIVRYGDISAQRDNPGLGTPNYDNIARGLFLFSLGLFKKIMIADNLAPFANAGFDLSAQLTLFDSWFISIAYTLQLYFDFSGYTDMAIGSGLMFNITLPVNFNSPYKSVSIQDFWRRWHITLSSFLRDYIYIPLGGNRRGSVMTYANLMITFLVAGIWHGAGWTFLFWGFLHGAALIVHRLWVKTGVQMPRMLAVFITFNFVNAGWVFFRARTFTEAINVLAAMTGLRGITLPALFEGLLGGFAGQFIRFSPQWMLRGDIFTVLLTAFLLAVAFTAKNSGELLERFTPDRKHILWASAALAVSLIFIQRHSEFIYFGF